MNDEQQNETQTQTEVEGAGEDAFDLDALLEEGRETQTKPDATTEAKTVEVDATEFAQLKGTVDTLVKSHVSQDVQQGLNSAVGRIQDYSDGLKELDAGLIETQLRGMADKDQRIIEAFNKRQEDPTRWNKILDGIAKEMDGAFPARGVDKTAAVAAAAGVSQTAPDGGDDNLPPQSDLANMSPSEWQAWKAKQGYSSGSHY